MRQFIFALSLLVGLLGAGTLHAHPGHDHSPDLRIWKDSDGLFEIAASFVQAQDDRVQLCKHDGATVWVPLAKLSPADRAWVRDRLDAIHRLNGSDSGPDQAALQARSTESSVSEPSSPLLAVTLVVAVSLLAAAGNALRRKAGAIPFVAAVAVVGSLGLAAVGKDDEKGPPAIQKHFAPFRDKVKFRFDEKTFLVESNGMPDHPMMIGIRAWQQQVPIPQPYAGRNAWRIPLHPRLADKPVSAKTALFRGAIALAVNGVPIFNPIKNDGKTDTFLAGELDEFGGHCGRADDYHYHIAPVHLEKVVGKGNPIAYALDGFPLFGYTDSDGKEPRDLDRFNGRMEKDGYRYYSTRKYPYVNGGLRGVVTVREDQIDPQPRANPIRPDLRPLRGARITGFSRDDEKKTYEVKYQRAGQTHSVRYTIGANGAYRFVFTDGTGKETAQTYRSRGPRGKGDRPPGKDGPPNKDDDRPRLPWIAAHFDELDGDKDGLLTLDELKSEVEKTFSGFDTNKDGKLTPEEYAGKRTSVKSALAGFVRGHADELADRNGTITKEALLEAMTRMFEKADRRKAGKLTRAEAALTGPKKRE